MSSAANKIDASDKNLRDILHSRKYNIDFFQREYKWQRKHLEQLLLDIEEAFLESYNLGDQLSDVSNYNSYYMGPLIFFEKSGIRSIIDGQQRLTTLTLVLIYIHNLQKDREDAEPIEEMIFSRKHGRTTFNIEVNERQPILKALYEENKYDINDDTNLTLINIYERYKDIEELFPEDLKSHKLPLLIDWMKEKLIFVEIVAYSDKNAFTIFETMNDRGYNLTPSEMLKGLLLSKVENERYLEEVNSIWREYISKLHYFSVDEDLEFFRAWFRGQYADTMKRSTAAGTAREDFEKIGTSFHRWVKENNKRLKLSSEESYYYFIKSDFVFYTSLYIRIKKLERNLTTGFQIVNFNSNYTIATSLSYPLYMSAISKTDSEEVISSKINLIAKFIDCYVFHRSIKGLAISQTSIRYTFFNSIIKEIRNFDVENLRWYLQNQLEIEGISYEALKDMSTIKTNRKFLRYFLSRATLFIEELVGRDADFYDFISARRKSGAHIEHMLLSIDEYEYSSPEDYYDDFGNIGAIALCRKDSHEVEEKELNLLYRVVARKELNTEEESILKSYFNLPSSELYSEEWIPDNHNFLIQISQKIWNYDLT